MHITSRSFSPIKFRNCLEEEMSILFNLDHTEDNRILVFFQYVPPPHKRKHEYETKIKQFDNQQTTSHKTD